MGSEEGRVGRGGADEDLGGRDRVRESRHSLIAGRKTRIARIIIIIIVKPGRRPRIRRIEKGKIVWRE